ncbi:hypothetical protein E6Q11_01700 [Candidatus Dojkabacteria bacterium]|uniref:Uncharacterized protein n=1 Tax=Candidatus Dojkabacteria bacterium TaxID=2099670 RepID=A0A5C7J9E2_9BACT|nr:MAG: hypothetical protein E6Q11_01700 [Candidatus Dojkabacteria bacterium]
MAKKYSKNAPVKEVQEEIKVEKSSGGVSDGKKVKMIFKEAKFYNDLANPIFFPNKVYELEGQDWIERWIKRGGAIIDENTNEPVVMDSDNKEKVEETVVHEEVSAKVEAKEDAEIL